VGAIAAHEAVQLALGRRAAERIGPRLAQQAVRARLEPVRELDRQVAGDRGGAHGVAAQVLLVEADRLQLLDLAVRGVMVAADRVRPGERVDQRMERAIDRAVRRDAERDRRQIIVALAACDAQEAAEQRDRAAVVDRCAPRRRLGRHPRDVADHLADVAMKVRQIGDEGAEPGGVVAADQPAAHRGGERRRGHRLAQRGEMDSLGRHCDTIAGGSATVTSRSGRRSVACQEVPRGDADIMDIPR